MKSYYVALPLTADMQQRICGLNQKFIAEHKEPLSKEAGQLMSEVACHVIDRVFGGMIELFAAQPDITDAMRANLQSSVGHIDHVKVVLKKYMPWAVSHFGNARLAPIMTYFVNQIQPQESGDMALTFDLPCEAAQRALLALCSLQRGHLQDAEGATESLVEVNEIGVQALIKHPKDLLKFNIVIDKTLNGVINVTLSMANKQLRQFGKQLKPIFFVPMSLHLQQFVKERTGAQLSCNS
jgi:hypothetical protein